MSRDLRYVACAGAANRRRIHRLRLSVASGSITRSCEAAFQKCRCASRANRGALWIAYIAFSIEILSLYGFTVGSILGTSLFFLIAALIVAALAYAALRLARRNTREELPA